MKRLLSLIIVLLVAQSLSAREVLNLCEDWRLFPASKSSGDDAITVSLPHCWSRDPAVPSNLTAAIYLRQIYAPKQWEEQRVFLKFYGVQNIADLFVNGKYIGEHRGGSTAFTFEITDHLNFEEDNAISLRVSSAAQNDVLPTSIEHAIDGGIYRNVELIVTPKTAISPIFHGSDGVFITTHNVKENKIDGDVTLRLLSNTTQERVAELTISDLSGAVCYTNRINKLKIDAGSSSTTIPFTVKGIEAWSPESPNLYRVTVKISPLNTFQKDAAEAEGVSLPDERQTDQVSITTGFRKITPPDNSEDNRMLKINAVPYQLRGVTLYHDHPMQGSVMTDNIYQSDINVIKEMGANAIRSAIAPHDGALYSLCDSEGIVVWIDTPLARSSFFSDIAYFPTTRFEDNGVQQLQEIIYQNYNHPSVAMWGIFSLLKDRGDNPIGYIRRLNTLAKSIDKSRPTVAVSNQNGDMNEVSDMIVWQQNIGWEIGSLSDIELWQNLIHSRWAYIQSGVMFGEKGLTRNQIERSLIPKCRTDHRNGWYPEVRQTEMHEEYMKHLSADSLFWGIWNTAMFDYRSPRSDIGESATGLVSFDRSTRKDAFYLYKAIWNKSEPTLHIADKRGRIVRDSLVSLRVYASDTLPPTATIKGVERQMVAVAPAQFRLDSIVSRGRTKIVVRQGDLSDSITLIQGSPLKAIEN